MRKLLVPASLCIAFAPACVAADPADPWLHARSANFDLYTTAGEGAAHNVIRQFERVHSFFEKAGFGGATANPVCLIVFRTDKEYQAYRPNQVAAAYFQPGMNQDYIVSTADMMTTHPEGAVHEYTHLMVRQSKHEIPVWLNEGLAELYSNMENQGKKVLVGRPIPGRLSSLAEEKWISVADLTSAAHDSPLYNEKNRAGIFYAESWLLVHMLFLESHYSPHYHDMSVALQAGDAASAFQNAYGKTMSQVDADLHAYIRRNSVSALLFGVELPKSSEAPEIDRAASLGARLALASLLTDTHNKRDAALAAYEQIERDYPNRWEVERGWAEYYWHERSTTDAAKHYARAVELGCNDLRSLIEYGRILGYSNRPADAVPILQKALALDPANEETHFELGIAMMHAGLYGASLAEFYAVKHIQPESAARYYYNLAYAIYRLGDFTQAQQLLDKGRPYATTTGDQNSIANLATTLAARRDAKAAPVQRTVTPPQPVSARPVENPEQETKPEAPVLQRRVESRPPKDGAVVLNLDKLPSEEGGLKSVDCQGTKLVLHLMVATVEKVFLIDDPNKVIIRSGDGAPVTFNCGPQKNQTVRIGYQPPAPGQRFVGIVRTLDFH